MNLEYITKAARCQECVPGVVEICSLQGGPQQPWGRSRTKVILQRLTNPVRGLDETNGYFFDGPVDMTSKLLDRPGKDDQRSQAAGHGQ